MAFPPLPGTVRERTVPELLEAAVAAAPERTALIAPSLLTGHEAERLSWAELAERAGRLATALQDRGVARGDRVAILFSNDGAVEAHLAYHAAHHLGAIAVPVNTRFVARELRYVLEFTAPAAVVFGAELSALVEEVVDRDAPPVLVHAGPGPALGEPLGTLLEGPAGPRETVGEEDDADWVLTSGTTGAPKAVALTQAGSVACGYECTGLWGVGPADIYQSSSPFFTSTGCHSNLLACLVAQCTYVVEPEFDVRATMRRVAEHGTTSVFLVSSALALMFHRLDEAELAALDLGALRRICYGAQTMSRPFYEQVRRVFGRPGHDLELVHLYGLTEGGTSGLLLDPELHDEAVDRAGPYGLTIGRRGFTPWIEHRVVDGNGTPVEPGAIGEIALRAPSVMSRYVADEAATAAALRDGWLRTGDMATVDEDGFVFFVDRQKQMIRRGGLNISSAEVEGVVLEHPAVEEAAAVPRPNPVLGEEVHLVVVLRPGGSVTADELIEHCSGLLADFKVPTSVAFTEALPRNAMGRIVKGALAGATVSEGKG